MGRKKSDAEPKKTGRPLIEITQQIIDSAEALAGQGLTQQQIALALGMGEATLYEKKAEFPEFAEAIKRGKAKGIAVISEKLLEKALAMDTTAIIFYLKCQAGWRDTQHIELDANIDFTQLTDEQLAAIAAGKSPR